MIVPRFENKDRCEDCPRDRAGAVSQRGRTETEKARRGGGGDLLDVARKGVQGEKGVMKP